MRKKRFSGRIAWYAVLCLLGLSLHSSYAQTREGLSIQELLRVRPDVRAEEVPMSKPVPMDGPVNASEYSVGPGDVLALNIWSSTPVSHQLSVTPEGSLLIPNVGVLAVGGLTLEMAKNQVGELVGRKYPNSEITLTLLSPRRIIVQVIGQVLSETMMEMSAVDRVDKLIQSANTLPATAIDVDYYEKTIPRIRANASERRILLKRKDGTEIPVDLVKYRVSGQGKYNPYLQEGDIVHVPSRQTLENAIGVFGGVRQSGSFEYASGDSLVDLVAMGFGLQPNVLGDHAVLTRLSPDGAEMLEYQVDVRAILNGHAPNLALRPGDRLVMHDPHDQRRNYFVSVEGEVLRPGLYPITRDRTMLSDVIRMAGGFTQKAYLRGSMLMRTHSVPGNAASEIDHEKLLSIRTNLSDQDSSYYMIETALRLRGEVVSVDYRKLFVEDDSTQDVVLRTYDRIIIAEKLRTVYVFGQVLRPGHVDYNEGQDYRYYIQKAQGYTRDAREGDVKIIKGGTRVWLDPDETTIDDGDYIWVPKEPVYPFAYYMNLYAQIAGIVGAAASIVLLVYTVTK